MKPTLIAPGVKRLKPKYDKPLSYFAFKINLRRCNLVAAALEDQDLLGLVAGAYTRSLLCST